MPNVEGLSETSIRYAKRFYTLYSQQITILPQVVGESERENLPQLVERLYSDFFYYLEGIIAISLTNVPMIQVRLCSMHTKHWKMAEVGMYCWICWVQICINAMVRLRQILRIHFRMWIAIWHKSWLETPTISLLPVYVENTMNDYWKIHCSVDQIWEKESWGQKSTAFIRLHPPVSQRIWPRGIYNI